jgi:hypothetical protein
MSGQSWYLLTAQPNIGNMYLRSIMHALTGLPDRPMCYSYWSTEHDIHLPHLTVDLNRGGYGQPLYSGYQCQYADSQSF